MPPVPRLRNLALAGGARGKEADPGRHVLQDRSELRPQTGRLRSGAS